MATKVFFLLTTLFMCSVYSLQTEEDLSFSIDIIHRDSPNSPFYNALDTHYFRLTKAIRRSFSRINRFKTSLKPSHSDPPEVIPDDGEYLMNVSIGTPPVEFLGIIDTGSDITWSQCEPCQECYKQKLPIFNPDNSSTYRNLSCNSKPCRTSDGTYCLDGKCMYTVSYGDKSLTSGNLAIETLTLKSISLPAFVLGCGHVNKGSFEQHGSGLIGLGGGPSSLISQLGSKINGKFSYCLIPYECTSSSSKMNFGSEGIVSGEGVVSTPLADTYPRTYYYLTLEGISVGSRRMRSEWLPSSTNDDGNIIIDSGTTLTFIPSNLYNEVETSIREAIHLEHLKVPHNEFRLCYNVSKLDELKAPRVTFHFKGADVVLQSLNTFFKLEEEGLVCFGLAPDPMAIFGNFAQMNFLIGYDLEAKTVSFKPVDCTRSPSKVTVSKASRSSSGN